MSLSDTLAPPRLSADDLARALGRPLPTPEQRAVIEGPLRPTLVVAGAGSGKTETMAARVVWLVANGYVAPEEVLGLTFTRKAATELSERISQRLDRLRDEGLWTQPPSEDGAAGLDTTATVSTYHAYAGRLVREHAVLLGHEPDARLLTEAAAWQYAAEAVAAYDGPMDAMDRRESTVVAAVIQLSGELAEHLRGPQEALAEVTRVLAHVRSLPGTLPAGGPVGELVANLELKAMVLPIVQAYAALKRSRDVLDFADQMALAARLAQEVPVVGEIERSRFSVVLLDEFQDTSEAQMELLRRLFATGPDRVPVTAVGDPHQSIYGWRGASASTLARFPEAFADRDGPAAELSLSTSWRNDQAVLDVANAVAAPLRADARVRVDQLRPRPGVGAGTVRVERLETQAEEAARVADWLAEVRAAHPGASAAVLCRKRSLFPAVVAALDVRGIPHEVLGLGGLLTTPEVQDLVAALHVVADPARGDQLMRLLTGPAVHLGAGDLDGLYAWARARQDRPGATGRRDGDLERDSSDVVSLVEAVSDLPAPGWHSHTGAHLSATALERLAGLARVLDRLRQHASSDLADLVGETERALGLDLEVLSRPEYTPAAARAHLDAFADVAAGFASGADRPTLGAFLAWLEAAEREERGLDKGYIEPREDAVQVLTVHSAKGLEWDVVAVPGLVEGTFPAHNAKTGATPDPQTGWRIGEVRDRGWVGGVSVSGIPYVLRGDADGLPVLAWSGTPDIPGLRTAVNAFHLDGGRHALNEERRLAYVAMTRARHALLLTAHVWGNTQRTPRVTSRFLEEVLPGAPEGSAARGSAADGLPVVVGTWAPMPPVDGREVERPERSGQEPAQWPDDPMARRRGHLLDVAGRVRLAVADPEDGSVAATSLGGGPGTAQRPGWADDLELLLRERAQQAGRREPVVDLPAHLSASALVALAEDEAAFADRLRRPMPSPPAAAARRGTAFHAWVEQHYRRAAFVDLDELPGSADEDAAEMLDADLPRLRAAFLASEWAERDPLALEVPVETVLAGVAVRGRVDAVFEVDGAEVVVDWKTGIPPTGSRAAAKALQLGVYALAWARLRGLPGDRVRAAFFYAASGETVWPSLPADAELTALLTGHGAAPDPSESGASSPVRREAERSSDTHVARPSSG